MSDQAQQPTGSLPPRWEVIDESLLRYTYDADQAIYPAPRLTYDRLRSWVDSCPEVCVVLRRRGLGARDDSQPQVSSSSAVSPSVFGTIIVLPLLSEFWARLVAEEQTETVTKPGGASLQEHDIDPRKMFPPSDCALGDEKAEVGLHVFHIERFPGFKMWEGRRLGFTQLALEEIRGRVDSRFPSWTVMGYSGMYWRQQHHLLFLVPSPSPSPVPL